MGPWLAPPSKSLRGSAVRFLEQLNRVQIPLEANRTLVRRDCPWQSISFFTGPARVTWAAASLSSEFHPKTNGHTKRMNQEMEVVLHCMVSLHQSSWSQQLLWVEWAHNILTSSSSSMYLFECSCGYQSPLFPFLEN